VDNLNIKILKAVVANEIGAFLQGGVTFISNFTGTWPEGVAVPTVNLSRKGDNPKCDTPITSLESHNGHAPAFQSQEDMDAYIDRVVKAVDAVAEPVQLPDSLKVALSDIDGLDNI
jgi:hypothetical protein